MSDLYAKITEQSNFSKVHIEKLKAISVSLHDVGLNQLSNRIENACRRLSKCFNDIENAMYRDMEKTK